MCVDRLGYVCAFEVALLLSIESRVGRLGIAWAFSHKG